MDSPGCREDSCQFSPFFSSPLTRPITKQIGAGFQGLTGAMSNVHYYTDNDYYTPDQNDGDNVSSELMREACETTGETNPNGPYGGFSDYDNQPRRRKGEPETPNHVLLMTILNPAYPITVDVIHTICQPYGNVLRIVIFKKNGVQAMVEFDGIDPATRAREGLQGADIYSGCCTLRIEYAKPSKLNVYKNDAESWDFTNPNVGGGMNGQMGGGPRGGGGLFNSPMPDSGGLMGSGQGQGGPFMGGAGGPGGASLSAMGQPQPGLPQQGAVLMVYGLNKDKMNADRIFNLLCLYGNIVRIKFLKTKEGCAMVQMGDALAVERAVANLNNTTFFGCKMQLGYSKQAFLADVQQPYDLPDGTPSFKDYMGNKNNRFINPEMASKNRIQPPSKILHFFNTPPGLDEETLKQVFLEGEVVEPKSIKLFPSKTERSSSGLLEFNNISEALEALVVGNHAPIPNPNSKFPFIMKLCFSSSRHIPNKMAE
ncbi:heterogeneous nuclear ribonucleoprotein L-like isoform X10 [Portunus trituberculatus]|uniref:heterogeneous nuclear ribonucleoprotein L-like isoform X10 n=1 Tax=Portunus trituberculatus TaxID=210409 RepID=UPI001E1CBD5C|nr:heterogeneous nuclear ribonucleoprotein L-like isoform X10 [Portunus trituberculatus]